MSLTLVVLAAGFGTRYGGVKQLEAVGPGGEALLDYALYDGLRAGCDRAVLVIRRDLEAAVREHLATVIGPDVPVTVAFQDLDALPPGFDVPSGREKPWGNAHAVIAAEPHVDGSFVTCNADDFYGAPAYRSLIAALRDAEQTDLPTHVLAGYRLQATLSPHGGVSRAACLTDSRGFVTGLVEVQDIRERSGRFTGRTVWGDPYPLEADTVVSTSLWGFTQAVFGTLREQFDCFLEAHAADPDVEFLLSTALNEQIGSGRARVKVVPAGESPWLGMTFAGDRQLVTQRLADFTARGVYPENFSRALAELIDRCN